MSTNPEVDAWMARYHEEQRLRALLHPGVDAHNKAVLLRALAEADLVRVDVAFDGYGDEGQIVGISCIGADDCERDSPLAQIEVQSVIHDGSGVTSSVMPAARAIEHVCYDLLEQHHSGWENNEGGYGSFTFDVARELITYTHNERYEHVETFEHAL